MSKPIEEWWPQLSIELRRWIASNYWTPMHDYARSEIRRLGGPDDDDEFWKRWDDGSLLLPESAVQWIVRQPDTGELAVKHEPDPRAKYFQHQRWPYRR